MKRRSPDRATRIHDLKEMTWQDVECLDKESTVITFTCGPVEQHGPQTPLGTDLYIAEYVMHRCAEHLANHDHTVIITPTVPYVNALFSLPYPGSVSIRHKIVEEYLFDLLASDNFRHLVLVSQHVDPPWVRAADSVCERVNQEYGARAIHGFERLVVDLLENPSPLDLPDLDSQGEAHAGIFETAPMLYVREHLVRKRLLKGLPPQRIPFSRFGGAGSFRELGNGLGYTGDPSRATAKIGGRIIEHYANRFKDLILRHVRGENVYDSLRFSGF